MISERAQGQAFATIEDARIVCRSATRQTAAFQAAAEYLVSHLPKPTHVDEHGREVWDIPTLAPHFGLTEAELIEDAEAAGVVLYIPSNQIHRIM